MKLLRFGEKGKEKPGIWWNGQRKDCSAWFEDWNPGFFRQEGLAELKSRNSAFDALPAVAKKERWAAPISRPALMVCIGLNYVDHAREADLAVPKEPILFLKPVNTISGPFDPVVIPEGCTKVDWELELAFVLQKDVFRLNTEEEATSAIAGYVMAIDLSERSYQMERGGQWAKGKSLPGFCPLGPWLTSSDEAADVSDLSMQLSVNEQTMQKGNTSDMIFKPAFILKYLSRFMQLEVGDLVLTGTPAGVAMGKDAGAYLKPGDKLDCSIDGMGCQLINFI